jgi:hypothetical protein
MKIGHNSGHESVGFGGVMKAFSRRRLAIACTLIAICFVIGAEPRKAAALIRKHQAFFHTTAVGKLYDVFAAGTGLVRVQDPQQPTRKPRWNGAADPPESADAVAQAPPQLLIPNTPAVGADDCPGATITSLPFSDSDTTTGANNTVTAIPGGCSTYTTVAGPDKIYTFSVVTAGSLTVTATPSGGTYDLAAYLISSCPGGTGNSVGSGCIMGADVVNTNTVETFTVANLAPGTYYLYIDSFYSSGTKSSGPYSLSVTGTAVLGESCVVTCPTNVTVSNDPNQCGAVVNYPAPTTSGSCGTVTCSPPPGSFFPVGTTTVNCPSSAGPMCSFTVTVNDTQTPTITCPANVTQGNDPNQCGAVVNYPPPTASDNCPGVTTMCSPPLGSFFPVGTTTVTCTAMDASPDSPNATCTFTVTINDTQPPVITCPADVTQPNDPNQCGAVVNYPTPGITDNCPGSFTAICNPPSGSFFPVGTTAVTCTVGVGTSRPSGGGGCTTITQSSSQAITPLNSVSCNSIDGHTDNSYWRAFTLSSFGIGGAFGVQSVDIGIEQATAGSSTRSGGKHTSSISKNSKTRVVNAPSATGQPLTVNLYTSNQPFPTGFPGALTLIGTASVMVADQAGTILNVPVTGTAAAGSQLVVEVFTPNGEAAGNFFFVGSNAAGESGPSYISAADCGITTPTPTSAIGFPEMQIVMNVNGCEAPSGPSCAFNVTVTNPAPTLSYGSQQVTVGQTGTINPATGPADTNSFTITLLSVVPAVGTISVDSTTGVVTVGNTTPVGSYVVTIRATDQCGAITDASFTLNVVCPTITLTPNLPNGMQGMAYNQTITASPAGGNYTYAVTTNILPPGLTLNSATGAITGTPSAPGNYTFVVTTTGWGGSCTKSQSYNLLITGTCSPITLNPTTLPSGTLGSSYPEASVSASGGVEPYSFAVTQGAMPAGLALNSSSGAITGTPAATGTFSFRITATGQGGCTGSRQYVVSVACGTLTFSPAGPALPNGTKGVAYSQTITVTPGSGYTYSTLLGGLPPGYTLNSTTGVISGITNQTGNYNFTIKVVSGGCQATKAYTLSVVNGTAASLAQSADYDGDGRSDFALWSNNGTWRLALSNGGANRQAQTLSWGQASDVSLWGDYDGDGQTDLAVFRPANGTWYVKRSGDGSFLVKAWGLATDVPVPGDYDGDGQTDLAVFRPSDGNWYVLRSSDQQYAVTAWGAGYAPYNDVAVPGDYDGDGRTDLAVFRRSNGTWLVKRSSDGQFFVKQWGLGTDVPVAADYDGDGRTDCAVWRGTSWYIWQSTTNSAQTAEWGSKEAPYFDQAVPSDYDGDSKADIAVWRADEQTWYVRCSLDGKVMTQAHGQVGDRAVRGN